MSKYYLHVTQTEFKSFILFMVQRMDGSQVLNPPACNEAMQPSGWTMSLLKRVQRRWSQSLLEFAIDVK